MLLEERFTSFVRSFRGEVIANLLAPGGDLPKNADYFLFNRSVVAELKCLEKDYFRAANIGVKLTALANRWLREGRLRPEQIADGRFLTSSLPERCALEVLGVFEKPVREAVTKANNQLKATKDHFGAHDAKGLLILANDGNYSLNPDLVSCILHRLFKDRFSAIDSFVYFAPDMEVSFPGVTKSTRIWISGSTRDPAPGVSSELLTRLREGWIQFIERENGEPVEIITPDDTHLVQDIEFTHRDVP